MEYIEEIAKIVENKLIENDEFFDYSQTPLEDICNKIYLYYKKLIEVNSDLYKIDPNYFFYKNNTTVNASAYVKNKNTLVGINIGTINQLKNLFLDKEEIIEEIFGKSIQNINKIFIKNNTSLMEYMFYSSIVFLINHEIGHLIQNNGKSEKKFDESIQQTEEFNIENHIYEVDSDIFASMKLTQDIYKAWQGFDEEDRTDMALCEIISLSISAIGIFKLFNLNAEKEIYYQEKSHPHVAIRYVLINENIVNYIAHIRGSKISDELKKNIVLNSFSIISDLNKFQKDSFFDNFVNLCIQNEVGVTKYGMFLFNEITKNERCAYYKMKSLEESESRSQLQ